MRTCLFLRRSSTLLVAVMTGLSSEKQKMPLLNRRRRRHAVFVLASSFLVLLNVSSSQAQFHVGFSKVDITPKQSLRLSGYASRAQSSTGVRDSLAARAFVISPAEPASEQQPPALSSKAVVLVSVDSILVTGALTVETARWLDSKYGLGRSQLVLSSTHSHAAPHIAGGLDNLYRTQSTEEQIAATARYTQRLSKSIRIAIEKAIDSLQPGKLVASESSASFAVNRRVLDGKGKWSGFGVQADGLRDQRVRLLRATTPDGKILGGAFMYACHCTTLGGDFNEVSGDWAGLAASQLEKLNSQSVFLPVIGCGANANPDPRGTYDNALNHAAEMVDAVNKALRQKGKLVGQTPDAKFGYAALAPEHPTAEEIRKQLAAERRNDRVWAETMRDTTQKMGRLPESYPMPIHTWAFGDDLTWVFLGGEVVVEYQFLLEKEFSSKNTWVAAYCDDVFAYVASENMLPQGGYEVDYSMVYYLQPGRWRAGTQALIVQRVSEIAGGIQVEKQPLSPAEALDALLVPDGFHVELVASEPLVKDPVNIAFGTDGVVWVVEMGDYPLGSSSGGSVRKLVDSNGDGHFDTSTVFLSGLAYPTSVTTYRDGVLVIAAPDIIFARDTSGDGVADEQRALLTGLAESNPQHRASGFVRGLDGRLHFGGGHGTRTLVDVQTSKEHAVQGKDVAWNPSTGDVEVTSGETQFVRSRDAFGNWFGNSNSRPIFHYVVEQRYLAGRQAATKQDLLTPAVAPPILPRTKELSRFNDLYAHRRFTSACSSIVLNEQPVAGGAGGVAFVCEPVHNLVSRLQVSGEHGSFSAVRHPDDSEFEFLTSTDQMFRPVRVVNAPDGSLWVVDMARSVIEHPEWIPLAWQQRIDLRSGSQLGRIYRIVPDGSGKARLPYLKGDLSEVLRAIQSPTRAHRDLAAQEIHAAGLDFEVHARDLLSSPMPEVRASALGVLEENGWLKTRDCVLALQDTDPRIVRQALVVTERLVLDSDSPIAELTGVLLKAANTGDVGVRTQWLLTASRIGDASWEPGIQALAAKASKERWMLEALSLLQNSVLANAAAIALLDSTARMQEQVSVREFSQLSSVLGKLLGQAGDENRKAVTDLYLAGSHGDAAEFPLARLLVLAEAASHGSRGDELLRKSIAQVTDRLGDDTTAPSQQVLLLNVLSSPLVPATDVLRVVEGLLVSDLTTRAVKQRAIETLREQSSGAVAERLLGLWPELTSQLQATAGQVLMARSSWVDQLVSALEQRKITPGDLDLATLEQLRVYGNRELRMRSLKVLGRPGDRDRVVEEYLGNLPSPSSVQGWSETGSVLFKQHCAVCHSPSADRIQAVGPPLENLKHWTLPQWTTAVMAPNQTVDAKYLTTQFLTESGRAYSGIVLQRSASQIRLAQADGKVVEVPLSEIVQEQASKKSLMPEGFESKLTPTQLAQLIAYLKKL